MHGRFLVTFVLLGTGYAAYTDLKTSEVADEVSMVVAGGGLLFHLWESLGAGPVEEAALVVATLLLTGGWAAILRRGPFHADEPTWMHVGSGIAAILASGSLYVTAGSGTPVTAAFLAGTGLFLFGWILYLAGAWGGADAFVLAAIGYALPVLPHGIDPTFKAPWPFLLSLITTTLLIGAAYSIAYAIYRTLRTPGALNTFRSRIGTDRGLIVSGAAAYTVASIAILVTGHVYGVPYRVLLPVLALGLVLLGATLLLTRFLRFVEEDLMRRTIPVDDLRPGDVLAEEVTLEAEEQLAEGPVEDLIGRAAARLNALIPFTSFERTETKIVGLTPEQVEEVRAKRDEVAIKTGVRFVPVFPAALVVLVLLGDPIWALYLFAA